MEANPAGAPAQKGAQPPATPDPADAQAVALALLADIQGRCADGNIAYARPPALLALGVETWVYAFELHRSPPAWAGPLVLRIFPPAENADRARLEEITQNTLANLGYPVPRVLAAAADPSVLGGPFLIMERVPGRMMLEALFGGTNLVAQLPRMIAQAVHEVPDTLAALQAELHSLDARMLTDALAQAGVDAGLYTLDGRLARLDALVSAHALDGLSPGLRWLEERRPLPVRPVICHADLLPPNVLMEHGRVSGVIDWGNMQVGHPAADVGGALARLRVDPVDVPAGLRPLFAVMRRLVARRYLGAYRRRRPIDRAAVRYFETLHIVEMLAQVGVHRRSPPATDDGRQPNPWLAPGAAVRPRRYLRAGTGLRVHLPGDPQ